MALTHLRVYDNLRRLSLGTIFLPINVGLVERNVELQILNILATFDLLLGRSWLYEHQVVLFTLHKKVKALTKGQVVNVE